MRHRLNRRRLPNRGRDRSWLMVNLSISLFSNRRILTTVAKAKALRPFAEKLVTIGKKGGLLLEEC